MHYWANWIKNITEATITGCSIQSLLKQVWVIIQICSITIGQHKLEPWTNYPQKRNDILLVLLPFYICSFSIEWMDYQLHPLSLVGSDAWNIFQKRGMHFIHLNINSLLPKIDEICYVAKLTNATVNRLSETKVDKTVFSSEDLVRSNRSRRGKIWWIPKRQDLVRSNQPRRGGGVACFLT